MSVKQILIVEDQMLARQYLCSCIEKAQNVKWQVL